MDVSTAITWLGGIAIGLSNLKPGYEPLKENLHLRLTNTFICSHDQLMDPRLQVHATELDLYSESPDSPLPMADNLARESTTGATETHSFSTPRNVLPDTTVRKILLSEIEMMNTSHYTPALVCWLQLLR